MSKDKHEFRDDPTEAERRKKLSEKQIRELELAGGVEGGMQAGSAGGPGEGDSERNPEESPDKKAPGSSR
jgi:hypothetical protein